MLADFAAYAAAQDQADALYMRRGSNGAARRPSTASTWDISRATAAFASTRTAFGTSGRSFERITDHRFRSLSVRRGKPPAHLRQARRASDAPGRGAGHAFRSVGAQRRTRQRRGALQSVERRRSRIATARLLGRVGTVRSASRGRHGIQVRDSGPRWAPSPQGRSVRFRHEAAPAKQLAGGLARRSRLARRRMDGDARP